MMLLIPARPRERSTVSPARSEPARSSSSLASLGDRSIGAAGRPLNLSTRPGVGFQDLTVAVWITCVYCGEHLAPKGPGGFMTQDERCQTCVFGNEIRLLRASPTGEPETLSTSCVVCSVCVDADRYLDWSATADLVVLAIFQAFARQAEPERCPYCGGHGADPMSDNVAWLPCPTCKGTGQVRR